ncbi:hypothetical protein CCR75_009798 [Bremia lactucae]|uniref:Uncharacterized protein n=1 Tax=Bremia lactucae TaxID=4779 RepID=A0A976FES1_BRELC|nr:hypothetical protein CCR75_009798 [Bremia lactucae]
MASSRAGVIALEDETRQIEHLAESFISLLELKCIQQQRLKIPREAEKATVQQSITQTLSLK